MPSTDLRTAPIRRPYTDFGPLSFLKMISATTGGTVVNYSARFSLSGMTGTFPDNVEAGIKKVSGTNGPSAQNNVVNNPGGAGGGAAGFSVPYTLQTGATKYAPMQRKPGTKISANKASAQYPTSSVQLAKTALPTPVQVTTMTMSGTYALPQSIENTVWNSETEGAILNYLANSIAGLSSSNADERHAEVPQPVEGLRGGYSGALREAFQRDGEGDRAACIDFAALNHGIFYGATANASWRSREFCTKMNNLKMTLTESERYSRIVLVFTLYSKCAPRPHVLLPARLTPRQHPSSTPPTMTETLPKGKYPAKAHCKKVADLLASTVEKDVPTILYLAGQTTRMQEDNDEPQPFRSAPALPPSTL